MLRGHARLSSGRKTGYLGGDEAWLMRWYGLQVNSLFRWLHNRWWHPPCVNTNPHSDFRHTFSHEAGSTLGPHYYDAGEYQSSIDHSVAVVSVDHRSLPMSRRLC
ncbi:hypothetical protein PAXRUDRAFT_357403 [Paxillus rubicundulus Ve08.2h10]|uniref:Uncharacterized protein n=1 Tax=Paxillus rubicundulus Ve08.2h10 TaxID=930991 RepID=A0A0D0EB37_9AGAM|nr:hypothetical protein PAXRUDRAFT_357403 [Paxillus rubicundulus Ve08.2h10]